MLRCSFAYKTFFLYDVLIIQYPAVAYLVTLAASL